MTTDTGLQQALNAIRRQQYDEGIKLLSGVIAGQPGNVKARWLLIQTLENVQQKGNALKEIQSLLIHVKKNLPAIDQLAAHMLKKRYPLKPALRAYKKHLAFEPGSANAAFNYAYYLAKDAQFEAAINMYERALKLGISNPEEVHLNIANIYMDHLQSHKQAKENLQLALTRNPGYAGAYYNLGNLSEQEGNREEAILNFEKCLEIDPRNESALARLADTQKYIEPGDPLLVRLVATARNSNNSDVHFALGKAYEQLGDFNMAWQHFSRGNSLDKRVLPIYRPEQTEAVFQSIMAKCDSGWINRCQGQRSHEPVFICGMFRTGSTLLEQVLASHPGFIAGGESEFFPRLVAREFPDFPQDLDNITNQGLCSWREKHHEQSKKLFGESRRVTDKRPDNFLYIGLIKAVLPSAKFVIMERDWRDTATSIYSVRLGLSQPYATSLKNIRHYIGLQTELVGHWESVLGSDLKRVRYEDLVHEPQTTVTDLLKWLGEPWDESCLAFHTLRNSVKTASVWQVREPFHVKSVKRWKNYKQQFAEVFGDELNA